MGTPPGRRMAERILRKKRISGPVQSGPGEEKSVESGTTTVPSLETLEMGHFTKDLGNFRRVMALVSNVSSTASKD